MPGGTRATESISQRVAQGSRVVDSEVPHGAAERAKRLGTACLTIRPAQPKVGLVAPAEQHVTVLDVVGDVPRTPE